MDLKECKKRLKEGQYFPNVDEHSAYRREVVDYVARNGFLNNAKIANIEIGPYTVGASENNDLTSVCKVFEFTRDLFSTGALIIS